MIRILVFGMTENPGGVESFLLNYYRHIDRNRIQFDFLCNSHNLVAYEEVLISLGARTFHITARSRNRRKYREELENVFRTHASEWTAIWVNVCSLANIDYLKIAKQYGIKKKIIHSHSSQNMDNCLRGLLHFWNKRQISKYATDFWACSEDAARWFYQDDLLGKAVIIHNAIDVEKMKFDSRKRNQIRSKYGWGDKYVIGNVGRLHFEKNQRFMIDIFKEYHVINPNSVLVLVGKGEDEALLKKQTADYGLEQDIFFTGVQTDIQGWLSSFDLFLFPSKFEGLSIAALEAQANGLPVLASKGVIPEDVKMNKNFCFYELDKDAHLWSQQIERMRILLREEYAEVKETFIRTGYDIEIESKKLEPLLIL